MSVVSFPDADVRPASDYDIGQEGYVIVMRTDLVGLNGPIYGRVGWSGHPERQGIFKTKEEAERVLAGPLH